MNDKIIQAVLDLVMENQECLFVIEMKEVNNYYTSPYNNVFDRNNCMLNINNDKERIIIKKLAELDGAVIINSAGYMMDFGVTLTNSENFIGHGKRHAFALGTSNKNGLICILKSEEDGHVRTFKEGICVIDIDGKTGLPIQTEQKIVEMLNTPISKILTTAGITTSILTLNPIPAIITFTGAYFIVAHGFEKLKDFFVN